MPHVARKMSPITAAPPSTGTTARASGERSRTATACAGSAVGAVGGAGTRMQSGCGLAGSHGHH